MDSETTTNHLLSRSVHQLLVELQQVKPVFGLSGFYVHLGKELPDHDDDLHKSLFVGIVFRRMFEDSFQ